MAFGDRGNQLVNIEGVPFRVDAPTWEEGAQQVLDMLAQAPEMFDHRATRLGLDEPDLDALKLTFDKGEGALHGHTREVSIGGFNDFRVGVGQQMMQRQRGARQIFAKMFGDEEAVNMISELQEEEDAIYEKLDKAGFGPEDIGEFGADLTAFLIPGTQGVMGSAVVGGLLGAADVREDPVGASIAADTAFGALLGAAVPAGMSTLKIGRGLLPTRFQGVSLPVRSEGRALGWLRFNWLRHNQGSTTRIVDEALSMTDEGMTGAQQIIRRAALDRVQQTIRSLPQTEAAGLLDEAAMGVVRKSLQEATETTASGVNVFNPAKWEASMSELTGRMGRIFGGAARRKATAASQSLASLNTLAREMQNLPVQMPVELAEQVSQAIIMAPSRAKPLMEAIQAASRPDVKFSLLQQLASIEVPAAAGLGRGAVIESGLNSQEAVTNFVEDF